MSAKNKELLFHSSGQFDDATEECEDTFFKIGYHATKQKNLTAIVPKDSTSTYYSQSQPTCKTDTQNVISDRKIQSDLIANPITEISSNDVLCGRGKGPCNYQGNIQFRHLIKTYQLIYLYCRKRMQKYHLCCLIFDKIKSMKPPGRFLQKIDRDECDIYKEIDSQKAMLKIGQALREGVTKEMIRSQERSSIKNIVTIKADNCK